MRTNKIAFLAIAIMAIVCGLSVWSVKAKASDPGTRTAMMCQTYCTPYGGCQTFCN